MSERTKSGRDVFTFSLSGLRTVAAYSVASAIAHDRINKAWDERLRQAQDDESVRGTEHGTINGRFWLSRRHGTAPGDWPRSEGQTDGGVPGQADWPD